MQLDRRDLASVAICCRSWSDSAYPLLYKDVRFTPLFPKKNKLSVDSAHLLCQTLQENPGIRSLIRYLAISHHIAFAWKIPAEVYSWIPLQPENSVKSLCFTCMAYEGTEHILDLVFKMPALRTLEEFHFRGQFNNYPEQIPQLLSITTLRYLDLYLQGNLEDFTFPRAALPHLRRLRISTDSTLHTPFVQKLIDAIGSSLELFVCSLGQFSNEGLDQLAHSIRFHTPNLHTLVLHAPYVTTPFLDDVVSHSTTLQSIYSSAGALSSGFLSTLPLPRGTNVFGLQYTDPDLFPEEAFCNALRAKGLNSLSRIYFVHGIDDCPSLQLLPMICRDLGIRYDTIERRDIFPDELLAVERW